MASGLNSTTTTPPETGGPFRYAAFISYRHVEPDRKWAAWLHSALETYRVPTSLVRERGLPVRIGRVFRDEEELPASASLSKSIQEALGQSNWLIVVCSPRTPVSEWVVEEVRRFRELGRGDRILALLIEGEPAESFPAPLREIRRIETDASGKRVSRIEEIEPLAADVRQALEGGSHSGHARRSAKLRLLAALLGVRYDDLRQREHERRVRFLAVAGAAVTALAVVLGILAVVALLQSREAHKQKQLAEARERDAIAAKQAAERSEKIANDQRSLAVDTLNSLIFQVQDKLEARPGLETMKRDVLTLAAEGLEKVERSARESGARADRSAGVVHQKLGDIYMTLGRTNDAAAMYRHALEILEPLARSDPENLLLKIDIAAALDRGGDAARILGDTTRSLQRYRQGIATSDALMIARPTDLGIKLNTAVTLDKLGDVNLATGDFNQAKAAMQRASDLRSEALAAAPTQRSMRRAVMQSQARLANLALAAGDIPAARAGHEAVVRQAEALLADDPKNATARRDVSIAYSYLGDATSPIDPKAAEQAYARALELDRAAVDEAPANVELKKDLIVSLKNLGDARRVQKPPGPAAPLYQEAATIAEALVKQDAGDTELRRSLAILYERIGDVAWAAKDMAGSRDAQTKCFQIRLQIASADPKNVVAQTDIVVSCARLGDLEFVAGHRDAAREHYQRGLTMLQRLQAEGLLAQQPKYVAWIGLLEKQVARTTPTTLPSTTQPAAQATTRAGE